MKHTTIRGGLILGLTFILWIMSSGGMVYAGVESGEFEKRVVVPLKQAYDAINAISVESSVSFSDDNQNDNSQESNASSSSSINIKVNYNFSSGNPQDKNENQEIIWIEPTLPPQPSYENYKNSMDSWWQEVQAENQRLSEQSKADLEKFRLESQQKLEQSKLEGQQGMEQFKIDMQKKQQEFLNSHGITP